MNRLGPVQPDRCLLLVNPLSFRLSLPGAFARLRHHTQNLGLVPHVVYGPQEIEPVLTQALAQGIDLIIIVGGDGTLQGTVSLLAKQGAQAAALPILMLGGGRTNYTAAHLGTQGRALATIERALTRPDSFELVEKASLCLKQADKEPVYGFFVGGALVDYVIRDCHRYRATGRGRLRQGRYSTVWRVVQLGLLGLLGRIGYKSPQMAFTASGLGQMAGAIRLLVMTTLDRDQVLVHPYLPRGRGPVKFSAIQKGARRFWRHLPSLLLGREQLAFTPEQGYLSGQTHQLDITGLRDVCVDGQEYTFDDEQVTTIEAGPVVRFLSL